MYKTYTDVAPINESTISPLYTLDNIPIGTKKINANKDIVDTLFLFLITEKTGIRKEKKSMFWPKIHIPAEYPPIQSLQLKYPQSDAPGKYVGNMSVEG